MDDQRQIEDLDAARRALATSDRQVAALRKRRAVFWLVLLVLGAAVSVAWYRATHEPFCGSPPNTCAHCVCSSSGEWVCDANTPLCKGSRLTF